MPWVYIRQYRYSETPDGYSGAPYTIHRHYNLQPLIFGGSSKGIPWGRLKEIHLHYTTINACSEDVTIYKASSPLSLSILMPIYYFYFAQGASSK